MADPLAPIADKIRPLIRLLSSDQSGEVLAAARALVRTLKANGLDVHALADGDGQANGTKLSRAEMQKLYDAGHQAGVRAVEDKLHGDEDFHNIDGTPSWHAIAIWCLRHDDRLRDNERKFVGDMASRTVWREPTEKQAKWLKSIFLRLGGKLP